MQSLTVTVVAKIRMRTSPLRGAGRLTSATCITSGGPQRVQMTAFTLAARRRSVDLETHSSQSRSAQLRTNLVQILFALDPGLHEAASRADEPRRIDRSEDGAVGGN